LSPTTGIPAEEWATAALSKLEARHSEELVAELRRAWEGSGAATQVQGDSPSPGSIVAEWPAAVG